MRDTNVIVIIGRLTRDAEYSVTKSGKELLKFSIANQFDKSVSFYNVACWGKMATAIKTYMLKGLQVNVHGRLDSSSYEDTNGNKVTRIGITANEIQMLSAPKKEEKTEGPANDDIPF